MQIQWYPGHMAKARRMLQENLKLCDVVIELVDARAPEASRNPDFDELFNAKERVIILNKSDLASPAVSKLWLAHYRTQGIEACLVNSVSPSAKKQLLSAIETATAEKVARRRERGITATVRAMVVGIPNVGKSTLINTIAGVARAQTGDRPGVTKSKQWVKITPYLELMDSPGLLWPKLENETYAAHLAMIGSINDEILDIEQLATELLVHLQRADCAALSARYKKITRETLKDELLKDMARSRGFLLPGGILDTERAARILLDEFRGGRIAKLSLERPGGEA